MHAYPSTDLYIVSSKGTLIPLNSFAQSVEAPQSLVDYIHTKESTDFKEDFLGDKPALAYVQTNQNKSDIYIYTAEIKNFVKRHFLLLQLLGLKRKMAERLSASDSLDSQRILNALKITANNPLSLNKNSRENA